MRILIAFASLSGNTRDLARLVRARCEAAGHAVTWIETDLHGLASAGQDPRYDPHHDLYLLGSWSDNSGRTPVEMKRFIAELVAAVGKPKRVAVFGTGETQWGHEYYCGAIRRIAAFFDSGYPRLEIEQMPHGEADARKIAHWADQVLAITLAMPEVERQQDPDSPDLAQTHAAQPDFGQSDADLPRHHP